MNKQYNNGERERKKELAACGRRWVLRILIFGIVLILPPLVTAYFSAQNAARGQPGYHVVELVFFIIAMAPFLTHAIFSLLYCGNRLEKRMLPADASRVILFGFAGMVLPMIYLWISAEIFFLQHLETAAPGEPRFGFVFDCYLYSFGLGLLGVLAGHWLRASR